MQGGKVYVRQRVATTPQRELHPTAEQDKQSLTTYLRHVDGHNEVYSVYLRSPIHKSPQEQSKRVYQIEVGTYDSERPRDYEFPRLTYAWKVSRRKNGNIIADDDVDPIALLIREFRVIGGRIAVQTAAAALEPAHEGIKFGVSSFDVRKIDGSDTFRRITQQ